MAVWIVPGDGKAGDVGGSHRDFSGNAGGAGLSVVSASGSRSERDLVVGADRLVFGGSGWLFVLLLAEAFGLSRLIPACFLSGIPA